MRAQGRKIENKEGRRRREREGGGRERISEGGEGWEGEDDRRKRDEKRKQK